METTKHRPNSALRWLRNHQTPHFNQEEDYRTRKESPASLIGADGRYRAGWFKDFRGRINTDEAVVSKRRFHRWFHLHFNTPDHFVVMNLADLSLAGNSALMILDKKTQRFHAESDTKMLFQKSIKVDPNVRWFEEASTGSFIRLAPNQKAGEEIIEFDLRVGSLEIYGRAKAIFGAPFVQITRYHGGNGTLQWWGNIEIINATLSVEGENYEVPPGSMGVYDRTVGHRRPIQNWNWFASNGIAVEKGIGKEVPFSLVASTDQDGASPVVSAAKNNLWIDDLFCKLPSMKFEYEVLDGDSSDTGPWKLSASEGDVNFSLHFEPSLHRKEHKRMPFFYDVDFNQYYGTVSGTLQVGKREFEVRDVFALTEDSWIVM